MNRQIAESVRAGSCYLGIELGSTRIKAVLTDERLIPVAQGSFTWSDKLENGIWTYDLGDAMRGVAAAYTDMKKDLKEKCGIVPEKLAGVSTFKWRYRPLTRRPAGLCSPIISRAGRWPTILTWKSSPLLPTATPHPTSPSSPTMRP